MQYSYTTADPLSYGLLKEFARQNRQSPTEAERALWTRLRDRQLGQPFRRQHIIGCFIADFISIPSKLIIEVDGRYHSLPEQQISDQERTAWLQEHGFRLLRFTNEQVLQDTENVIKLIKDHLL